MAGNKTTETGADVDAFLETIEDAQKKADSVALRDMMERISGEPAKMWGPSIVGFGRYQYKYDSGREGEFMLTGFAPRKANLSVYVMPGFDRYGEELARLGKHKTAKSCLSIKKLEDIDTGVLGEIVADSVAVMRERYGT